ncbi:HAD-like domain-containing protein [Phycomyces nitens]|nr:HAD-like domain-containing protein [Phycomyces nitens]
MTGNTRIKLITFDAFNTLFRQRVNPSVIYAKEAHRFGINVSAKALQTHFGPVYKSHVKAFPFYGIHQGKTPHRWWQELVYKTFLSSGVSNKELDPNFDTLFDSLYHRFTSTESYALFPDTLPGLNTLREKGFRMGIISNSDERLMDILKSLEVESYFDFVTLSVDIGHEKPDKNIFEVARRTNGDVPPRDCLHVGDTERKDYYGALNAGWNAVLLDREKLDFEEPFEVIDPNLKSNTLVSLLDLYPFILKNFS